jgi:hypothetical protein
LANGGMKLMPQYEVEAYDGPAMQRVTYVAEKDEKGKHLGFKKDVEEIKGGYMVYFAQGHSIYVETAEELARLGLSEDAKIVDMESGEVAPDSVISLKARVASKTRNERH